MHPILLYLHSITRWIMLLALVYALFRAYRGWLTAGSWSKSDSQARKFTTLIAHVQLLIGLMLYFVSPMVDYFLSETAMAMKIKVFRFYGLEHGLMMLVGVVLITMAGVRAKRVTSDKAKFKNYAIWLTIALLIIFAAIPWPFMNPEIARPMWPR